MPKDEKLLWQSFDIRLRPVAHILTELQSFFCGIYLPSITHFLFSTLATSKPNIVTGEKSKQTAVIEITT